MNSMLLLGSTGYIGSKFGEKLGTFHGLPHGEVNVQSLLNLWTGTQFKTIINCAGYVGRPNVDAVEKNKEDAVYGNIVLPSVLVEFANIVKDVTILHVSTGCVYTDNGQHLHYTEEDPPNLDWNSVDPCSFYGGTKSMAEKIIARFPQHYICRLRMPFDEEGGERNYLSKLMKYNILLSRPNSITHRGDFIKACLAMLKKKVEFGIYNVVNTGAITAKQTCRLINKYFSPKEFDFFKNEEEFYTNTGCGPRSNCILSNQKLLDAGIKMRKAKTAIEHSLKNWR